MSFIILWWFYESHLWHRDLLNWTGPCRCPEYILPGDFLCELHDFILWKCTLFCFSWIKCRDCQWFIIITCAYCTCVFTVFIFTDWVEREDNFFIFLSSHASCIWSVHHFGPHWIISRTIRWIAFKVLTVMFPSVVTSLAALSFHLAKI